jgi:hypothetical protein
MAPRWRPSAKPLRTETASSLGDSADRLQGRVADADAGCWYPWTRINCLLRGLASTRTLLRDQLLSRKSIYSSHFCQRPSGTPWNVLFFWSSRLASFLPADRVMDGNSRIVAVWLHDDHARVIVGAAPAAKPSRWAIEGTIVETNNVGLWLRTHAIHEFRPVTVGAKSVNWRFTSTELLIRWEAVITIQAFESSGKDIGFTPADG